MKNKNSKWYKKPPLTLYNNLFYLKRYIYIYIYIMTWIMAFN